MKRYRTVDEYIDEAREWREELVQLRKILRGTDLTEEVKWGAPCYTYEGKVLVGLGAFKSYFGLWFFQGVLLADKKKVLMNCQEGKTKAMRQWRMASKEDIDVSIIRAYVKEAIALQKAGKAILPDRNKPLTVPPQLKEALARDKKAGAAFKELTRGKQREYADYTAEAKRDETRVARVAKILPMIAAGEGLNDKYRKG